MVFLSHIKHTHTPETYPYPNDYLTKSNPYPNLKPNLHPKIGDFSKVTKFQQKAT